MGKQEEPENSGVGDLVVKSLAMKMKEGGIDADIVAPTGSQALQFTEDADGITSSLDDIRL